MIRGLAAAALIITGCLLAGCGDPKQAVNECRFELQKASPGVDLDTPDPVVTPKVVTFMETCMQAKGYEDKPASDTDSMYCGLLWGGQRPECYRKKGLF
jgi:hypothetical protein